MKLLVRFFGEMRPYVRTMVLVGFLTVFNAILSLQIPRIIGGLFNQLDPKVAPTNPPNLPLVFVEIVGLAIVTGTVAYFLTQTVTALGHLFMLNTRRKVFAHLESLSQGFFEKSQVGKIVSTIVNDIGQVNQLITGGFVTVLADGVTLIGVLIIIFVFKDWYLSLLALSVYPIYIINFLVMLK